jgi:hypothetical protein
MRQAEASTTDGKTPAVVLHGDRRRYADALVLCCLSEFAALVNALERSNPQKGSARTVKPALFRGLLCQPVASTPTFANMRLGSVPAYRALFSSAR